ncbi:MFS transporter [Streptomyces sclerotialus]|uniref:MFS transporter n=1 Tax=Streptomyces sclerotialus TaxID=1957 RepID=UPI00099BA4B0
MLSLRRDGRTSARREPLGSPFRRFQSAVVSSDLADGIYKIAVPLIALGMTRSAVAVSLVGVAVRLPWLVAMLPAGVVADRYEPRSVMRWASAVRLGLVVAMCVAAVLGRLPLWTLAVLAFAVGCAGTFVDVAAQSALPRLVTAGQLPRANAALQSTQMFLAQLVGPALGGYVVALGSGLGLSTVVVLYVVTVWALGILPAAVGGAAVVAKAPPPEAERPHDDEPKPRQRASLRSMVSELGEGLRHFKGRPDLIRLATTAAVNNLSYAMCLTLLPLQAVAPGQLGLSETGYGLLLTCLAVGSVLAGPLTGRIVGRVGERRLMRCGGPLAGLCYLALAAPSVPVAAAGLFCYGLVSIVWNVVVVSYRQTTIPAEIFGRVNAAYRWITWGVFPLGSLVAGALAALLGTTTVFLVAGALPLIAAVVVPVTTALATAADDTEAADDAPAQAAT